MREQPDFVIVCDHGIPGGQRDPVTRYPWWPDRGDWWPTRDDDVQLTPLEGDQHGWNPHRLMSGYQEKPDEVPRRLHHEILCRADDCTLWAYRSDDDKLQTLFRLIVSDQRFHNVCVSVTDTEITVTLRALQLVHDTADRLGFFQ